MTHFVTYGRQLLTAEPLLAGQKLFCCLHRTCTGTRACLALHESCLGTHAHTHTHLLLLSMGLTPSARCSSSRVRPDSFCCRLPTSCLYCTGQARQDSRTVPQHDSGRTEPCCTQHQHEARQMTGASMVSAGVLTGQHSAGRECAWGNAADCMAPTQSLPLLSLTPGRWGSWSVPLPRAG